MLVGLAAASTSTGIGHDEVLRKLDSLKPNCRVSINGKTVLNSQEVISILKTLDWVPAHHSHPTTRITVDITDHAPRLVFSLGRDSDDPREYWVFWPKYHITAQTKLAGSKHLYSTFTDAKPGDRFGEGAETSMRGRVRSPIQSFEFA